MSHPYLGLSEAEQYDALRDKGISPQAAASHIMALRTAREGQASDAAGQEQPFNPWGVGAGLADAGLDLVKAVPQTIVGGPAAWLHAGGQITGVGNIPAAWRTFQDPNADWAEKADALIRATPANVGYAPERALMEATGANPYNPGNPNYGEAEGPGSTEDITHRAGNVASLALLGVKPGAIGRALEPFTPPIVRSGLKAITPPIVQAIGKRLVGGKPAAIPEGPTFTPPAEPEIAPPTPPRPVDPEVTQAWNDLQAGKITRADFDAANARAWGDTPSAVAPTVPTEPPASSPATAPGAPVPPAAVAAGTESAPVMDAPTFIRRGGAVRPDNSPMGATRFANIKEGTLPERPTPPAPGTLPYYPRGGALEQSVGAPPVSSMPPSPPGMLAASLPLAKALGQAPEEFTGGLTQVADALQHPAYQYAEMLAQRAVSQGLPGFQGLSLGDATALLRRMIVERAEQGGDVPPLTTLPRFLQRLQTSPGSLAGGAR